MASLSTTVAAMRRLGSSMHSGRIWRALPTPLATAPHRRALSASAPRRTDGVFRDLTDSRPRLPWIEAFRQQQEGNSLGLVKPNSTRDLRPKAMRDSYHRVVLPLGRDPWLSDTYINASGHIRLGAIFMDLDALSGIVVHKHTGSGLTTVTAAVDRIELTHALTEICDLEYSGMVTYAAGGSSAEITCKVARARAEGERSRAEDLLLTCTFTMVALDPRTRRPTAIPRIEAATLEEEALYAAGAARSEAARVARKTSLRAAAPDDAESELIHRIWQRQVRDEDAERGQGTADNVVAMRQTQLSTAAIMQPQYRNLHQTMIFGGYHLKQTFELAFCCAASFAHARPTFVSADPCTFESPVPVGSVLYLTATVAYTDPPVVAGNEERANTVDSTAGQPPRTRVHVRVESKVREMEHGTAKATGQFHYTFTVPKDVRVLPHTYEEYMHYIDARRRVLVGAVAHPSESTGRVNLTE